MTPDDAALAAETTALLRFARAAAVPGGFADLDAAGRVTPGAPLQLYVVCRMTHVFGLAVLLGEDQQAADLLDHGVAALLGPWQDARHGGWFAALAPGGAGPVQRRKEAYAHAFVVLAGATAAAAGHPRGPKLLDRALAVLRERFWDDAHGMVVDAWDEAFGACDPYRGLNANMHAVEALLAAHDVTGDGWSLTASERIARRVVDDLGPAFGWRLPEHFGEAWRPLPDLNRDRPADPFRPYGVTIGHLLEWARLLRHLGAALVRAGRPATAPATHVADAATALTAAAVRDGWAVDGRDGFVYTVDFDGRPVVTARMHWVVAEAVAEAAGRVADGVEPVDAADQLDRWLAFAWRYHRDPIGGSWWHELDADLRPAGTVWPGKPDVYHALQALWLARWARPADGGRSPAAGMVSFAGVAAARR